MTLDCANGLIEQLCRVLKVMIIIRKPTSRRCSMYIPAIAMHITSLVYQRDNNTRIWQMMQEHLSCFNEQIGELSFSSLAHAMVGDTKRADFAHINRLYKMGTATRTVVGDIKEEIGHLYKSSDRITIKPDAPELLAVTAHMERTIAAMRSGAWMMYTNECVEKLPTHAHFELISPQSPRLIWSPSSRADAKGYFRKAVKETVGRWLDAYADIWPEVNQEVSSSDSSDDVPLYADNHRHSKRRRQVRDPGVFVRS